MYVYVHISIYMSICTYLYAYVSRSCSSQLRGDVGGPPAMSQAASRSSTRAILAAARQTPWRPLFTLRCTWALVEGVKTLGV